MQLVHPQLVHHNCCGWHHKVSSKGAKMDNGKMIFVFNLSLFLVHIEVVYFDVCKHGCKQKPMSYFKS